MTVTVERNYPREKEAHGETGFVTGWYASPSRRKQVPLEGEVWMKVDPLALQIYEDVMWQ